MFVTIRTTPQSAIFSGGDRRGVHHRQLAAEPLVERRRGDDRDAVGAEEAEGLDVIDEAVGRFDLGRADLLQRQNARECATTTASHDEMTTPRSGNMTM